MWQEKEVAKKDMGGSDPEEVTSGEVVNQP